MKSDSSRKAKECESGISISSRTEHRCFIYLAGRLEHEC